MSENVSRNLIFWFFVLCFLASFLLLGKLFYPFISILVMAAVVSSIFYPLYRYFQRARYVGPHLASLVTCFLVFLILFIPIVFFVGILTQEAYSLYQTARDAGIDDQITGILDQTRILDKVNTVLQTFDIQITGEQLENSISKAGKSIGLFLYQQATAFASNILSFVVNFFLMLLVVFFLLIDGQRLVSFIVDLSPLPSDQDRILIDKFNDMAGAILIGNGLGGLIQGVLGGLAFWFLKIPSAFLWGAIMGLLAFLPIVGIGAVFVPAAIYVFLKGRVAAGIFMIIFYLLLSGGIEYIFKPKLVGQRVKMHTLMVFFSIIGGLKVFGILGIIYGPLIVTAFLTLTEIYRANYQWLVEPEQNT